MPPVKPITGNAATPPKPVPAPKPAPTPQTPPKPASPPPAPKPAPTPATVSKPTTPETFPLTQSKDSGELAKQCEQLAIPSWLQVDDNMPETMGGMNTGFVGFGSSQSGKWAEQQAAGIEDGDPYLFHQKAYIPLKSLNFFLLMGESFQSLMVGKKGTFMWASRDLELEGPTVGNNSPEAHYVCLLLVNVNGSLIPIKGDFRGTKSRGLESAISAVKAAALPEWLGLSDAHKITAMYPQPWGRVYHRVTTSYYVSKSNGNSCYVTNCICSPASIDQMQMLVDHFSDSDWVNQLEEAKQNYNARIQFMDKICNDPPINRQQTTPVSG